MFWVFKKPRLAIRQENPFFFNFIFFFSCRPLFEGREGFACETWSPSDILFGKTRGFFFFFFLCSPIYTYLIGTLLHGLYSLM